MISTNNINPHRLLLCTDMDRTVIPNGDQVEHVNAREQFKAFCALPEVTLAYVTGRHSMLVTDAIEEYDLPEPDFAITDVGTQIHRIVDGQWQLQQNWEHEIARAWDINNHQKLRRVLSHIKSLQLQEASKQNAFKLSYYLPLTEDKELLIARVEKNFNEIGVSASLIWSVDEPNNIGLLDILPPNATKLHAIEFLQQVLGYQHNEVIFAGDSGNDLPVLCSQIPSVLVSNASDEIKEIAEKQIELNGYQGALYVAKDGVLNMNGNYSAGVLQGIWHYAEHFRKYLE